MNINKFFSSAILITVFSFGNLFGQVYTIEQTEGTSGSQTYVQGQTFTTENSGGILSISVDPYKLTNNVTFEIFEGQCQTLLYSDTVDIASYNWAKFVLSEPVYVKDSSIYTFRFYNLEEDLFFEIAEGNPYEGGGKISRTCTVSSEYDLMFKVEIDESQPPPEMDILESGNNLADGSTYQFGGIEIGTVRERTFVINNPGKGKLKLTTPVEFEPGADPEFSILSQPDSEIEPGQSSSFTLRFTPTTTDLKSASIVIPNNDDDENPYNLTFTGSSGVPEINLKEGQTDIADGGSYDYGYVDLNWFTDVWFTIENTGTALLILTTPLTLNGPDTDHFILVNQPAGDIAAGESTIFRVRSTPSTMGSKTVSIEIPSNDADEDPYNLTLNATPADVEINVKQSTTDIENGVAFNFDDTDVGDTTEVVFTIENIGHASRDLTITTPLSLSGTNADQFEIISQPNSTISSGTNSAFTIRFSPTSYGYKHAEISIENNDADEDPYEISFIGNGIGTPEMEIYGNSVLISDNDDTPSSTDNTDFGTTAVSGGSAAHTFIIKNTGDGLLELDGDPRVSISGENPSDFTVTRIPYSSVNPYGGEIMFEITFDPASNGIKNAEVSISNNDADENPYNFSITGIGDNETAPNVATYLPEDNGEVYVRRDLVLQFNEEVFPVSSKNIAIYNQTNLVEQIPVDDARVTVNVNEVTIHHDVSFIKETEYYVEIDAGAFTDIVDETYAGIQISSTWNFTAVKSEPPGRVYHFDGTDDYASASINLPDAGTIEFWFNLDILSQSQYFFNCHTFYWYMGYTANDKIYCRVSQNNYLLSDALQQDKWYHAAVVWQKFGSFVNSYLYINGSLVAYFLNDVWVSPEENFYIGSSSTSAKYLNGYIDEFRIWSEARTMLEIQNNMFKALTGDETNLLAYFDFDDYYGAGLYDASGNANNGTLNNTSEDWETSTAPFGEYGKPVRSGSAVSVGVDGKSLSTEITSSTDNDNHLGIYSCGKGDTKITTDDFGSSGTTGRSNIIWGIEEFGSCTADLIFNYSNIAGFSTEEEALKLLKRDDANSPWVDVTAEALQNTSDHTFTITGCSDYSEFSIGDGGENPLPVELTAFSAELLDDKVLLQWQTATEVDNYGFEVERTLNPPLSFGHPLPGGETKGWVKIGFVEGHGNSNSPKKYSFTNPLNLDLTLPHASSLLYRLKQIDTDGSFEYSDIVKVTLNNELPIKFELFQNYPNPFNPTTIIEYSIPSQNASLVMVGDKINISLKVYDILGREVATLVNAKQPAGMYKVEFDASQLASGIYVYRLTAGSFLKSMKAVYIR
ncbi:MAG: choice-of-anchor D domain-containing protein [Melioribacteraceae bacterium]|nr:choice-of-anchor D domain-containing protein [Melioribacteraceae bacterium]MCF8354249.1 choice-of-anchor D domain-containing protein [Melioribacteraceae bacterium]MCF8394813.1 choice-of-anchor D domain-containing protein [Melioribacteraceae bacterium]MCF8417980.1 choice-of-anchor D domain-containing protein [Melioribacteraceae bacterium]